jgi:predicted Fe-Mo cluster-binding NifX family protein
MVCIPVDGEGTVDPRWGRAGRVAVAEVADGRLVDWRVIEVGWDRLHDETTEGGHHARVARFLQANRIGLVLAGHMGEGMRRMLDRMGIEVQVGVEGDARHAVMTRIGTVGSP